MAETYNGWANRETWALEVELTNDRGLYELTRERVREALKSGHEQHRCTHCKICAGEAVKALWAELADPDSELNQDSGFEDFVDLRVPLLTAVGSDWRIDWDEIGAAWLEDVTS